MPCARNKVFNRLEALHGKPSLSIALNTISKTKKYICALTFNQATWFTYKERWFKWVTAIRITLIIFEFANLWLNALNEGQVYPWVHRWRLIVLVHIYTTLSPSAAKLLLPVQQNCYSNNFLDQLRAFPPPFGQSPSGLPITQDFCLMLNGKVDPEKWTISWYVSTLKSTLEKSINVFPKKALSTLYGRYQVFLLGVYTSMNTPLYNPQDELLAIFWEP